MRDLKKLNLKKYKAIFITGTDTGVGKTFVAALLVKASRHLGIKAGIMKPISCGPDNDAAYLKKLLKLNDPLELINPYNLPLPLAPYANKLEQKKKFRFDKRKVKAALKKLQSKYALVLVEGVGGLLVPITKNYLVEDLIKDLKIPVIVVARAGLGTINHTLLTINRLKEKRLKVLGIIMNGFKGDLSEKTNAQAIEALTSTKVIARVPWEN